MSADLLRRLIEAGTPADLIADVAEMIGDLKSLEKRRAADRQRQQDKRDRDAHHVTSRDVTDNPETAPLSLPPNENNSNPPAHTPVRDTPAREGRPDLPEGCTAEQWRDFAEMRRRIRKPMTPAAERLALRKLRRFADDGYPPGAILEQSTMNCWQDLFPPKDRTHGHRAANDRSQDDLTNPMVRAVNSRRARRAAFEGDDGGVRVPPGH